MAGSKVKKYLTLVMDGSDINVLSHIINTIDCTAGNKDRKTIWYPLDSNHPSLMVLETFTNEQRYNSIKTVIEKLYPGLCVFNPAV